MRRINLTFWPIVALIAAVVTLLGCGGAAGTGGGSGTLAVHLADAPAPNITALNITIPKVEANVGGQWVIVAEPNQTYNLLDFAVSDTLLGQASLPAGSYTQIRLFVSDASLVDDTGTHSVIVPSGAQTGIKLNVNFTIEENTVTDVLMDFNVDKSLILQGNGQYRLQPVIPVVVKVLSGTITGITTDGANPIAGATITATYTEGTSYPLGTEVNSNMSQSDGAFKIWALLPGKYTLTFSYTDPNTSTTVSASLTDVVVDANGNTDVGSVPLS